jgi:hypothetical protein
MSKVLFRGPSGESVQNPSEDYLRGLITAPPKGFWGQGSGDAELELENMAGEKLSLLILPHEGLGFYLKFLKTEGRRIVDTWLSLSNKTRLTEVVPCSDEWMASVGLFLAPDAAATAVGEFARTGRRTEAISWIRPDEIPEGGNW